MIDHPDHSGHKRLNQVPEARAYGIECRYQNMLLCINSWVNDGWFVTDTVTVN